MIKRTLLFSSPAYLHTRHEQLVVETKGQTPPRTVPIEDLGAVVLEHAEISISQTAIAKLLANNTAVVYCDAQHYPAGLLLPLDGNTLQQERFEQQIAASAPLKKQLWQQTVRAKIKNQALVLEYAGHSALPLLFKLKQVRSGDPTNEEGQAARLYWQQLFAPLKFGRDRFGLPPNNLLNYGYAILRAAVARALVGSGLLPTLGIHHHNRYNAFCLADDLMEPYRPWVDRLVLELVRTDLTGEYPLDKASKASLLGLLTQDVLLREQRHPLMIALSQTTASLVRCFAAETDEILYPTFVP
jgi:CRISP-associated protein Cas1